MVRIKVDVTSNAEFRLSDFFENFRMISLECDVVMGQINRIRYANNRIYVSDRNTMFIFSDSGEFLSHFSKVGRGPGEYIRLQDFAINNDTIIILDWDGRKLLQYNYLGKFFSEHRLGYFARAISPIINQYFFLYAGNEYDGVNNTHRLRRLRNGQPGSLCLPIDRNKANYLHIQWQHHFFLHQDTVYFFEAFNDTIYKSVGGNKMKPAFFVDYKGKNVPASFFERNFADARDFFQEFHRRSSYAYGVSNFVINDHLLMFGSFYRGNRKLTLFNRKNENSHTFSTIRDDVFFNGLTIPIAEFSYFADNGYIFLPLDADMVVEWRGVYPLGKYFKEVVNAVRRDDNPVLLIFNLKP